MTDTWRDRLQPASFRGVQFHTDRSSGTGGRRVVVHEYAGQDGYDTEDLGQQSGEYTLAAFLVGPDYDIARDTLIKALDEPGAGSLVHPHLGTQSVRITGYTWSLSTRQGGYVRIDIRYVKAARRRPAPVVNSASILAQAAAAASATAQTAFSERFSVSGASDAVTNSATDILGDAISAMRTVNGRINAGVAELQGVASDIDTLASELATLISAPANLISTAAGVVSSILGAYSNIKQAFNAYDQLLAGFRINRTIQRTSANGTETATRARMADNQAAISDALVTLAMVGMCDLIASGASPFESYDQAISIRDSLLDQLAERAASAELSYDEYDALSRLQSALHRRVQEVAPGLQSIKYVSLGVSLPAVVVAHQQYGDATRADELATRNGINHPLFMPAGKTLEVLS
jgi:prophage DNA circulation protein